MNAHPELLDLGNNIPSYSARRRPKITLDESDTAAVDMVKAAQCKTHVSAGAGVLPSTVESNLVHSWCKKTPQSTLLE